MNILIWLLVVLLVLKVFWNFTVPYQLLILSYHHDGKQPKQGISLSLEIEMILLFLASMISYFSEGDSFINEPLSILRYGGGAILSSYLHFFIAGMIGGMIVSIIKRTKQKNDALSSDGIDLKSNASSSDGID